MNIHTLIQTAASLLEPSDPEASPEYVRGMAEFIAESHPEPGVPMGDRAETVYKAIVIMASLEV